MNCRQRIEHYDRTFPNYSGTLFTFRDRIYGLWMLGQYYKRTHGFYGEYPHKVKERMLALFPDCTNILHLFSGTIKDLNTITYDISSQFKPTICDDIRNVKNHVDVFKDIDLCIADPPYSKSDFEKYGQVPFNKPKVIRELGEIMKSGSYLVWLDTMVPIYSKKTWELYGHIALIISTNTRIRCWSLWKHV